MQPTNFPFGKELRPYRYGEIETPFLIKTQMYDVPIGQWRYKAYFWRKVFFINLGISILLTLFFIMIASVRPFNIVVVSVTPEGHVRNVSSLNLDHKADVALYQDFIFSGLATMLNQAQHQQLNPIGKSQLELFFSNEAKKVFESFLVDNKVTMFNLNVCQFSVNNKIGCLLVLNNDQSQQYQINLTWQQIVPQEEQIKLNPLGLYIKSIAIKPIEQLNLKGDKPNGLKEKSE
ncbi:MAG: hypothetical protein EP298_03110 [Gammaproteobacteria bacterium]|nr:MAG: hypothetical protein EP298_03110 [Gammaproteobacteria bacterium]UTW43584.1 hypothetical protein KFE69_05705 [bacterium SCSIO 12844]